MNDRDILELFREADSTPEPDVRRIDVAAAVSQGKRQRRTGVARRAAIATGAIAACVAGAVVVAGLPVFDDTPVGAPSAAAAVLNEAASNAGKAAPATTPRSDQYVYTRTHGWGGSAVWYSSTKHAEGAPHTVDRVAYYVGEGVHEKWQSVGNPKATTVIRSTEGLTRKPLRPSDVQNLKDAGVDLNRPPERSISPDPSQANNPRFKPNPWPPGTDFSDPFSFPTPKTLATLPTDADKLLAQVRDQAAGHGDSRDGQAFVVITNLFKDADPLIGRELRAALFRAAAKIPGIERWASVNLDGQRGIAIGRRDAKDGQRQEIIVDPSTSRIIGERTVQVRLVAPEPGEVTNGEIPIGTVTNLTSIRSIIVDRSLQTTSN